MKKIKIIILVFSMIFFNHSLVFAKKRNLKIKDEKAVQEFFKDLNQNFISKKTLTAEFEQTQKNLILATTKTSTGIIEIALPNKFRWETLSPKKNLLISDGEMVYYYIAPEKEGMKGELISKKAKEVQSELAIALLSGRIDLKHSFRAIYIKEGHFELTPQKQAADIERIELFVNQKTKEINKIILLHASGNETQLVLKNIKTGVSISDSRFKLPTKL